MTETWKPIPGYENWYEASDQGRIRSVDRTIVDQAGRVRRLKGVIAKPFSTNHGHQIVSISNGKTRTKKLVHRLVLAAFTGADDETSHVLHWNDDPRDNRLENLRYGTQKENIHDTIRNGHNVNSNKETCPRGHELAAPNLVPSVAKTGSRSCLACSRAKGYIGNHPELKDSFKELSDNYYRAILNGTYRKRRGSWLIHT